MPGFRSFPVRLPSGIRYWTVIDEGLRPVVEVDEFLLHARLGRDLAESTTRAYATGIGLFLDWCARTGVPWREAAGSLGRFVYWLQHYAPEREGWVLGEPVRGARRVNGVLAAVREFLKHAVSVGELDAGVLDALFEVCYDVDLPAEVRGESNARMRARARHRLREPETVVDALSEQDALGLLRACRSARDRFIVLTLWRMGLRRGELTGVRREDVHFVPDASPLGCPIRGAHLHVIKRDNGNGAAAKSRRARAVPADWLVVQAYDQYMIERDACVAAADCDFLLVNLFRAPIGAPMRPQALNERLAELSARAGLARSVHPHQARHAFATAVTGAGGSLDEVKELLGHAALTSSQPYLHPDAARLRAAVERVGSPRLSLGGQS